MMEPRKASTALENRRQGDPLACQRIWDAIKNARQHRQAATLEMLQRYCCKTYSEMSEKQVEDQVKLLVLDGLLIEKVTIGAKGSKKGSEQLIYTIPLEEEVQFDKKKDWYCFSCHKPGEVLTCSSCPRVHHLSCLAENKPNDFNKIDNFTCPICKGIENSAVDDDSRSEFNNLLSYVCARLLDSLEHKDKLPADYINVWNPSADIPIYAAPFTTDRCAAIANKTHLHGSSQVISADTEPWRANFLLQSLMDLVKMDSKADRQVYKSMMQFQLDAMAILHNVCVFHGENSPLADKARIMLRDCLYELSEIKLCRDCYKRSNEQMADDWFCEPCYPRHELVFAKAKGYPYWPAKVLKKADDMYDVRFFGSGHDRATLSQTFIKPITSDPFSLVNPKQRTNKWNKAMEELHVHQEKLKALDEYEDSTEEERNSGKRSRSPSPEKNEQEPVFKSMRVSLERLPKSFFNGTYTSASTSTAMESEGDVARRIASLEEKVKSLKEKHAADLQAVKEMYGKDKPTSTDRTVQELESKHAAAMQELKWQLMKSHEEIVKSMKSKHANEVASLKERVARLEQQLQQANEKISSNQTPATTMEGRAVHQLLSCDTLTSNEKALLQEMERMKNRHVAEIQELKDQHKKDLDLIKSKPWCKKCASEGLLHCCLNEWYCSTDCQRLAWREHKIICKRDRSDRSANRVEMNQKSSTNRTSSSNDQQKNDAVA